MPLAGTPPNVADSPLARSHRNSATGYYSPMASRVWDLEAIGPNDCCPVAATASPPMPALQAQKINRWGEESVEEDGLDGAAAIKGWSTLE